MLYIFADTPTRIQLHDFQIIYCLDALGDVKTKRWKRKLAQWIAFEFEDNRNNNKKRKQTTRK